MSFTGLTQGLLHLPGSTYESKTLVKRLLDEDREKHHCFWGRAGYHNHLPHHLLAVYDLGAASNTLQAIYSTDAVKAYPINTIDRQQQVTGDINLVLTSENWFKEVGDEKNYVAFLAFFKSEIQSLGVSKTLENYVFSETANAGETKMLARLVGGALHPLIQVGYGLEFNEPMLVASGLAQTAVHSPFNSALYDAALPTADTSPVSQDTRQKLMRQPSKGASLLSIIRQMYDSEILKPVMPYDPDALIRKRYADAMSNGRPEEIRRLSALWTVDPTAGDKEFEERVEELIWLSTLLTAATGKHGRKPRLDFFLMHCLTSSLFLPSFMKSISKAEDKARLLRIMVPVILFIVLSRGRPRIDPTLIMSYTQFPHPPIIGTPPKLVDQVFSKPYDASYVNPWPAIIASAVHFPEAHVVKAIRTLYYAAEKYGDTPPGGATGAFDEDGQETLEGTAHMDGTIFVRAAGVVMDTLGWVTHGQKAGEWDRSALGWDAAWDTDD